MATFTTNRQFFRQHASTPWYVESTEYRQHVDATYRDTEKIISSTSELSDDLLVLTKTTVWANEEARTEFINDPIVIAEIAARQIYHDDHGISFNVVVPLS